MMNFQRLKFCVQKVFRAKGKFIFGTYDVQTCFIKPKKKKLCQGHGTKA